MLTHLHITKEGILLKSVDFDGTGEGAGDVLYNNTDLGAGTQLPLTHG